MTSRTHSSALAVLIVLAAAPVPAPAVRDASSGPAASSGSAASSESAASSGRGESSANAAASGRAASSAGAEQARRSAAIQVPEATGIRRTEYPVNARVQLPKGALADAARARLRLSDAETPAQYSAESRWDDGAV